MQIAELFERGTEWKHRERGFLVFIRDVLEPGKFTLSFVSKTPVFETTFENSMDGLILYGVWTAEELLRDFDPMPMRPTRYDHIFEDDLFGVGEGHDDPGAA